MVARCTLGSAGRWLFACLDELQLLLPFYLGGLELLLCHRCFELDTDGKACRGYIHGTPLNDRNALGLSRKPRQQQF